MDCYELILKLSYEIDESIIGDTDISLDRN